MTLQTPEPLLDSATSAETVETELHPEAPINMAERAAEAAGFLKTLAHEGRLMILCHLGAGEKSVGTLESLLDMRQAAVSQMLARLRDEGLVQTRREGKTIYYSLKDQNTQELIALLYRQFCSPDS
ncbi:metalloregulator ArsR/SmtB family transcription factor [Pseudophaeobacter arcticus]|uniref:Metalloregulator ArsR/SmtB family transcription factor n=2 Tax=Pseudophaeobacter arcticus TaxID=385492 RepID=A0ABQ0AM11_9RHOB